MGKCEVCGNMYDKAFEVRILEQSYMFDCFECAIHLLAPTCSQCGCKIVGHGVESGDKFYCSAQCARAKGVEGVVDRVPQPA